MSPFWAQARPSEVLAPDGSPRSLRGELGWQHIARISAHWRVHTLWWTEEEVWRDYWQVASEHALLVLYQDLLGGVWYLERQYD